MPILYDDTAAMAALAQLLPKVLLGAERGLSQIAPVVEDAMRTDPSHGNVTGAAHASYFVAPLGGAQDGQSVADHAYAVAAEHITNYTKHGLSGHGGQAERIDVQTIGEFERGLLLGSPVSYAQELASEDRSPVEPILHQYAPAMKDAAARGIREALK